MRLERLYLDKLLFRNWEATRAAFYDEGRRRRSPAAAAQGAVSHGYRSRG